MRFSPLVMATVYFLVGVAFTYFGIQSIEDTVWNMMTILMAIFATFDFAISFRLIRLHIRIKKAMNSKK
ncbi:hypothetical protein GCM10011351_27130 [Paraliobacillus quinghaiensis]|uniref:DUF4305 domain-containing protein n=1 Tax=Paraliobacillus quinghaiensis TaxID=470815 RepID=A0A917TVL7_9BACI|nr:YdiK family protein [Paraliobacillus quinghaiensis]GGM39535.1 hypothetical protein GCM10011351_27130 [Paraliobacillus quinghaiensis]